MMLRFLIFWIFTDYCIGYNLTLYKAGPSIAEYKNFVKYLFLSANDFQIYPEPLKCTDIDPVKQLVWDFPAHNEGVRICDLCPYLPQSKLIDIVIDLEPFVSFKSSVSDQAFQISECFDRCVELDQCVALSFDHVLEMCYIFNSTDGDFERQDKWTSVLINQPTEVVAGWTYTRHSKLSLNNADNVTDEQSFLDCVHTCEIYSKDTKKSHCHAVSYNFENRTCFVFSNLSSVDFNYEYGTVTAFHLEMIQRNVAHAWRFVESFNNEEANSKTLKNKIRNDNRCLLPSNEALGNFFATHCLTSNGLGCDQSSLGCQLCYYPEISGDYQNNLTICQNSQFTNTPKRSEVLDLCYEKCILELDCIAVDVNKNMECNIIRISEWHSPPASWKRYDLLYPEPSSILAKFSWYPQSALQPIDVPGSGTILKKLDTTVVDCLSSCFSNADCQKVSYSPNGRVCSHANDRIGFTSYNSFKDGDLSDSISFFRKPEINTERFHFHRSPGWELTSSNYTDRFAFICNYTGCSTDIIRTCLRYCLYNETSTCQFVSFQYFEQQNQENIICLLYGPTTEDMEHGIVKSVNGEIFTRSLKELNLKNLNMISIFQQNDLKGCFEMDISFKQSDLQNSSNLFYENQQLSPIEPVIRRKKRFISFLAKGIKKIGKFVIDQVKDIVDTVIETGKAAVKVVKNVVQGDFKGAVDAIGEIPIVKHISDAAKNTIKLGKAIASGDLSSAGSALLDIASSKALDIIPIGRVTGRLTRIVSKAGKKVTNRLKKIQEKVRNRIKKGKKAKPKGSRRGKNKRKDKDGGEICRVRRQAHSGKRKRCDKEDKKKPKCMKPKIINSITRSLQGCDFKRQGGSCEFSCRAGFTEEPSDNVICKQDPVNKKKASYSPKPRCEKSSCENGIYPVIPVTVPSSIGEVALYVVKYNKARKLPLWSIAYHDSLNGLHWFKRLTRFLQHPCNELENHQPKNSDYKNSGWDRGHLTPAEPMTFSLKSTYLVNFYINAAPQDPYTNKGPWRVMEGHVSCFMKRTKGLVATGICPSNIGKTKRNSQIQVPGCFWKMICFKTNGRAHVVGFLSSNSKVSTSKDKNDRADQIMNPISQQEIMTKATVNPSLWVTASKFVFKGKLVRSAFSKGITSVTPLECMRELSLDAAEKLKWKNALLGKNGSRRKARQIQDSRGCTASEMKSMASLLGLSTLSMQELKANPPTIIEDNVGSDENESLGTVTAEAYACGRRVIGYYPSWGKGDFSPLQAQKLTHVVYAFLEMKADGHIIVGNSDPDNIEATSTLLERLEQLIDVANQFPHLKLMFAVGGWGNSQYFSDVVRDTNKRLNFISSTLKIIKTFDFDGIDVDWEYPVTGGATEGVPEDKGNYVLLMRELREVLNQFQKEEGREDPYLISFAGAAGSWTLEPGYDLPGLMKYADWVNVMTYDYFGAWDSKWGAYTGPPAPLHFAMPPRFSGKTNVDFTIKYYVCQLKSPDQINMGVPFYGRFWKNVGNLVNKDFSMWRKAEPVNGKFEGGFVSWKEISEKYIPNPAFQKHFHEGSKTPYAWNPQDKIFLGYEDNKSLQYKVQYAADKNLGGLMVWAIDQDDSEYTMLNILARANICMKKNPKEIFHKCSPISERRWWVWDEDKKKAGMCGRSAPLYKGYYPLCDPDDPGYSCCGPAGYCGNGPQYCSCPTCKDFAKHPEKLTEEPIKPSQSIQWYTNDAPNGKRGRCGRDVPKLNGQYAICNPDDENGHCCSNGGYCGNSPTHCTCDGCVNFKQKPNFRYTEKKWWTWGDGPDVSGRCGPSAPKLNGNVPICDPDSLNAFCCSSGGYCGNSPAHCTCSGCVNFKATPDYIYPEKQWWTWADGADKSGKCGTSAPVINGKMAICDPNSSNAYCCSVSGYCGNSRGHCDCNGCINYKQLKGRK